MRHALLAASLALGVLSVVACEKPAENVAALAENPEIVARAVRFDGVLADSSARSDTSHGDSQPVARWLLPTALQEISGLALTSDERLLVHNDELPQVWEIDYRRGLLVKRFKLGNGTLKADFEGIAVVRDAVFLMTSTGKLYEFHEGAEGESVPYTVHDLKLQDVCEFEGLAFDAATNSLMIPCKEVLSKTGRDSLLIYRWSVDSASGHKVSVLAVALAPIIGPRGWKGLHPSDITVDPVTGNYVIIAAIEKALVSITPAGALVFTRSLDDRHTHAEGLAITKSGILIIGDEASTQPAALTLYKWR